MREKAVANQTREGQVVQNEHRTRVVRLRAPFDHLLTAARTNIDRLILVYRTDETVTCFGLFIEM